MTVVDRVTDVDRVEAIVRKKFGLRKKKHYQPLYDLMLIRRRHQVKITREENLGTKVNLDTDPGKSKSGSYYCKY